LLYWPAEGPVFALLRFGEGSDGAYLSGGRLSCGDWSGIDGADL
jgi:hypothetical protein